MKKINEENIPFKYGTYGSKYLFNENDFSGGVAYLKKGEDIKLHTHDRETEIFYFIKGTPLFLYKDEKIRVKEGEGYIVFSGEEHGILNDTEETVKLVFLKVKNK